MKFPMSFFAKANNPPKPTLFRPAARAGALVCLAVLLMASHAWARTAPQQDDTAQFDDLAARAAAAREAQNIPLAIDLYEQAGRLKPDWVEGWFYLGVLQYNSKQFQPAIDAFNHLLQLQPSLASARALRGLCEFETASYDDALRDLDAAVAQGAANDPRNAPLLRFDLAQLLVRARRYPEAVAQYTIFASHRIEDPDLLIGLGLAGLEVPLLSKDVPAADRDLYESAGRAGFVFLSGDSKQADAIFAGLFTRYPTTPNLHLFYGRLLLQHDPDLAIRQFQAELAVAPTNIPARCILAYALMTSGRYTEAVPEAERALSQVPGQQVAELALGRSLVETGDIQRGAELLNDVLKADPNNLEAHMGLAAMYSLTGRREDAHREHLLCLQLGQK